MKLHQMEINARHTRFKRDLEKLLNKHAGKLSAQELLAISAQVCGMIAAVQDKRSMTPAQAMEIIVENIKNGNQLIAGDKLTAH